LFAILAMASVTNKMIMRGGRLYHELLEIIAIGFGFGLSVAYSPRCRHGNGAGLRYTTFRLWDYVHI
jgi:hypothetical protein